MKWMNEMQLRWLRWNVKLKKKGKGPHASGDGVEDFPKHAVVNERNFMRLMHNVFVNRKCAPALMAAALGLLIAGCASNPPPPYQPPPAQAAPPPPALTGDQMTILCQAAPDTCRRIQTGQPLILADVKAMVKIGFSDDVIIAQVRNSHTVFHLTANAIIDLKNSGVSDQVIDFLISTPSAIAGSTPFPEPTNAYMAQTPPPAPPAETPPPTPGPDYVWIGGDWVWNGGWVWVGGHWAFPPYPHAFWFHGRWSRRGWGGYRHEPGRWR
jgi:hypothetical protein